ncbi:hypothetical protein [Corynebacterium sp.]|uniref:hypothetical protein n=1 Tax=Corynebacterium sp. TaxID=1720 RepID=UPI003B3A1DCC
MPYPMSVTRPLARLLDWYRRPGDGVHPATDSTVLGVLPGTCPERGARGTVGSRQTQPPRDTMTLPRTVRPEHTDPATRVFSPASLGIVGTDGTAGHTPDVLALLIDEGRTPATPHDVRTAFRALQGRRPSAAESAAACTTVASFGLLA